jgi:RNA polymerase sigma-70 factor, ECF subfamily
VPLLNTHSCPPTTDKPAHNYAGSGLRGLLVSVEKMASAGRTRSCGEEVLLVTGIRRCVQSADDRQDEANSDYEVDDRSIPLRRNNREWRQQTMQLYDALAPKLKQFVRGLGLSKEEIDDVIQESFLRLAAHLREENNEGSLGSWVYRVARNLAMDVHRARRREHEEIDLELEPEREPIDREADPEWVYLQKERSRQLKAALSQLTKQQYNSILLRTQGLRYREIGALLGISEQRAIHLVKRGLHRLTGGL